MIMSDYKQAKLKGVPEPIEVNEDGSIVKYKGRVLNQYSIVTSKNSNGYKSVTIHGKSRYVHRIVAEAFIRNTKPISHKFVLHLDNDITNNHFSNLKWGSAKDLNAKNRQMFIDRGESYRGSSKISHEEALKIAKRLDNGEFAKDICKEYGVSEMSIARIRKRYCSAKNASPRYNNEIKATVFKLAQKYSAPEIATITGLKYHTVYRWLKNRGDKSEKPAFYY